MTCLYWKKDPGDTEVFSLVWYSSDPTVKYLLDATESIVSSSWTLPTPLTSALDTHDATSTSVWIAGGVVGEEYDVVNSVITDSGRELDRHVTLQVENLYAQ